MSLIELQQILLGLVALISVPSLAAHFVPGVVRGKEREQMSGQADGRVAFFDVVRGVTIIAVVLIHVTYLFPQVSEVSDRTLTTLNNLLRFAIPIFILTSGMLLASPQPSWRWYGLFLWRRFVTIGLPYIVVVGLLALEYRYDLQTFFLKIITGTAEVPFYYMIALFQLYLLYPLLYQVAKSRVGVWGSLVFSVIAILVPYPPEIFPFTHVLPLVFFFVWGMYLKDFTKQSLERLALWPWMSLVIVYVGVLAVFEPVRFYNTQFTYGPAVFVLFYFLYRRFSSHYQLVQAWLVAVGKNSLWIFLTHFAVLRYLFEVWLEVRPHLSEVDLIGLSIVGVGISIVVAFAARWLYAYLNTMIKQVVRITVKNFVHA